QASSLSCSCLHHYVRAAPKCAFPAGRDRRRTGSDLPRRMHSVLRLAKALSCGVRLRAEIGIDHGLVVADLVGRTFGQDPAVTQNANGIRYPKDDIHIVLDEDEGELALLP